MNVHSYNCMMAGGSCICGGDGTDNDLPISSGTNDADDIYAVSMRNIKCLRGEHEADVFISRAVDMNAEHVHHINSCRHCHCLYVEQS